MTLRLILVAHAPTGATKAAAFPLDESILPAHRAEAASRAGAFGRVDMAWTSPARRAVETAAALGLRAQVEPALRDLDLGRWAGRTLDAVSDADPAGLQLWASGTDRTPHGGEAIDELIGRVASWMEDLRAAHGRPPVTTPNVTTPHLTTTHVAATHVAVTHAAVIRAAAIAALGADRLSFWRIEVAPLSLSEFRAGGARWSVCGLNRGIG